MLKWRLKYVMWTNPVVRYEFVLLDQELVSSSPHFESTLPLLLFFSLWGFFVTKGVMKTTQANRNAKLAARLRGSWFRILDAMNKAAHIINRTQPHSWNFSSRSPLLADIFLPSQLGSKQCNKGITRPSQHNNLRQRWTTHRRGGRVRKNICFSRIFLV